MPQKLPPAKEYHAIKRRIFFVEFLIQLGFLVLLQQTVSRSLGLGTAVYLVILFNALYVLAFPLHFYGSHLLEQLFGLSNQKAAAWFKDELKRYALGLLFFVGISLGFLFLVKNFPSTWWLWAGLGWFCLTVVLTKILPEVLIPLFYKTRSLPEGALKGALLDLCARCRVFTSDIRQIELSQKTKKANAALVGLGRSRRILLGDTLTDRYSLDEIRMVVAHEIGHHAKRHIGQNLGFNFLAALLGFGILHALSARWVRFFGGESLADLAIFPSLLGLSMAANFFWLPIQNTFGRHLENEADRYAVSIIPSWEIFRSLMLKLGHQNLADPDPPRWVELWFYDHPSIPNRLRRVRAILGSP